MKNKMAMIPRSIALFLILCQFRFAAKDLADSWVFVVIVFVGFVIAVFLSKKKMIVSLAAIALFPWAARFVVALPRMFFPGMTDAVLVLDALLLHIDRNYFVALVPFYWIAFTTFFAFHSRTFLRGEILAADVLLAVIFSIAKTEDLYPLPVFMIGLFASVAFLQLVAFILSAPPELKARIREKAAAVLAALALVVLSGVLFLKPTQEVASRKSGGLLQPKMFKFDFSQILKLESEISMNDDLMFIVKKEGGGILLRRYVMSGYKKGIGFFRTDVDQETQPAILPNSSTNLVPDFPAKKKTNIVEQEYFIVNFDSHAFIAMNQPIAVAPFENWDASSFNSAYAVKSLVVSFNDAYENMEENIPPTKDEPRYDLSAEEYVFYTDFGKDERIKAFAEEITRDEESMNGKIAAVYTKLKHSEYVYSLKPGIAPDGDQLAYFLFDSKKGYCSYYAFAFALILRSMGIPCRVAAGFFVDPETNAFNYYPVRSDMAHAWVEVFFPSLGWIEFDPTSQTLAAGEEFTFSKGVDSELFSRLMREILENHSRLKPKQVVVDDSAQSGLVKLALDAVRLVKKYWGVVLILMALCAILLLKARFLILSNLSRNPRKKAIFLWRHTKARLRQRNMPIFAPDSFEHEWARQNNAAYTLYCCASAARFAPVYTMANFLKMKVYYEKLWVSTR